MALFENRFIVVDIKVKKNRKDACFVWKNGNVNEDARKKSSIKMEEDSIK